MGPLVTGPPRPSVEANPFSTRMVRPGSIAYRFPPGADWGTLIDRLATMRWWGQIVGPHGTGKSTLLKGLIHELESRGRRVAVTTVRSDHTLWPWNWSVGRGRRTDTQVIIDGYEQLPVLSRLWLKHRCWRAGCGLLVTTHHDVGFATLWQTKVSPELASQLVSELRGRELNPTECDFIAGCLETHAGNLREVFFDLYDRFERKFPLDGS